MLAALIARKILRTMWAAASHDGVEGPILDPADRRYSWRDATLWAVTAGIGLGIAKVISTPAAVVGWEAATGTLPPGIEEPVEI